MNFLQRGLQLKQFRSVMSRFYSAKSKEEIDHLVKNNKVVVFMKGVPEQPQCGFSNAVVQIFRMHGVSYDAHNVLQDDSLRQGIVLTDQSLIKIRFCNTVHSPLITTLFLSKR